MKYLLRQTSDAISGQKITWNPAISETMHSLAQVLICGQVSLKLADSSFILRLILTIF